MFFRKKYYLCTDSIGEKTMFIRKLIPSLIVIVSAILFANMAATDILTVTSGDYSSKKQNMTEQEEVSDPFLGEITDAYKFIIVPSEGWLSQPSFRIQSPTCDNVSEEEISEFFRSYYNGMQHVAYKSIKIGLYATVTGLQDPQYYIYTLRRIII